MDPATFLTELKRRKVYRVAVAYAIVAWLLIQAASILFPTFEAPLWVMKVFVTAVILGFPVALILAWVFELTPQGIRRSEQAAPRESKICKAGRNWTAIVVAGVLLTVAAGTVVLWRSNILRLENRGSVIPAASHAIVVLPFENASNDPNVEYLAEGISETLINSLSELRNLRVVARATAFQYKGKQVDPERIGRELRVRAVVSGRVRQVQDALSIQVDLIDATNGTQLWGQSYDGKLSDALAVKQAIAREVTGKLKLRLSGEEERRLMQRDTVNAAAYQFYLKGRYFWNQRTADGLEKGISYFRKAIEADPAYALAYVGLADSYNFLGAFGIAILSPDEAMPKAKSAARKALEVDDSLSEAHASLAFVELYYEWDWAGAEKSFRRAIELNPNYAPAYQWYSHLLMSGGRTSDAISAAKRAAEIDPLSLPAVMNVGWQYHWARQYDSAVEQLRRVLQINPNFEQAHWALGLAYVGQAKMEEAVAELQKAIALSGGNSVYVAGLGDAYALGGNKAEAIRLRSELEQKTSYVSPYWMATLQAALGEQDLALVSLEKAFAERNGGLIWIGADPRMDSLRSDPRFAALVERVGIPP
jgi:TolB-like protein/Tfp pilus assembly protein PilF